MLKIWCESCRGAGEWPDDTCDVCQGKGYTELEHVWIGKPELGVQVDLLDVLYYLKEGKKISIYVKDEE